jgi:hypothetical protein
MRHIFVSMPERSYRVLSCWSLTTLQYQRPKDHLDWDPLIMNILITTLYSRNRYHITNKQRPSQAHEQNRTEQVNDLPLEMVNAGLQLSFKISKQIPPASLMLQ